MKFYGLRVYDMEECMVASGFPMLKRKYTPKEYEWEVKNLKDYMKIWEKDALIEYAQLSKEERDKLEDTLRKALNHIRRSCNLGNSKPSSGHDCFCKGIAVHVNIEADQSFWLQWERYHFQDTVSSMSTMHCLCKFENVSEMFSEHTDPRNIAILNEKIDEYNNNPTPENFHKVIHNCPQGIELCRRVILNYLQVKTMISQREFHKMLSWKRDFTRLSEELPYFKEFTRNLN